MFAYCSSEEHRDLALLSHQTDVSKSDIIRHGVRLHGLLSRMTMEGYTIQFRHDTTGVVHDQIMARELIAKPAV